MKSARKKTAEMHGYSVSFARIHRPHELTCSLTISLLSHGESQKAHLADRVGQAAHGSEH